MPLHFFNLLQVPADREGEFFELWREVNAYLAARPGYLSHQLHRATGPATYTFINHAIWSSAEEYAAATDAGFHALVTQPAWAQFPSTPGLYDVVHEGRQQTAQETQLLIPRHVPPR